MSDHQPLTPPSSQAPPDEPVASPTGAPLLPELPHAAAAIPAGQQLQRLQAEYWQGQFPPPDAIERYELVRPGSFDRMIKMAERLQQAQIEQTSLALNYAKADARRGQWLGFVATALSILSAAVCAGFGSVTHMTGPFWVAGLLVGVPVMAVARALVESTRTAAAESAHVRIGRPTAPEPPPK